MKQGIYVQSELAKYPIGLRYKEPGPMGRTFHYCKAAPLGCAQPYWGAQNNHDFNTDGTEDCISGTTVGAKTIGERTLVITGTIGAPVADFFKNGLAVVTVVSTLQMYRIKSSTAAGSSVTLTLYDSLAIAIPEGSVIVVYPNIYSKVERVLGGGDAKRTTVCVPNIIVTGNYYFWGQTYGPCYGIPSEAFPSGSYDQSLVFSHDGSVKLVEAHTTNMHHQLAGYRLVNYKADEPGALVFYMLQLAP